MYQKAMQAPFDSKTLIHPEQKPFKKSIWLFQSALRQTIDALIGITK